MRQADEYTWWYFDERIAAPQLAARRIESERTEVVDGAGHPRTMSDRAGESKARVGTVVDLGANLLHRTSALSHGDP